MTSNLFVCFIISTHLVTAIGYATSYGGERLVIKIGDTIYQAGDDLEEKVDTLQANCLIKILKVRVNPTRHAKYAVCKIYEPGDWTASVEYAKTPMLSKHDGSTCVVDVRSIEVKGKKRKLLLTDEGVVYKLKRSKLEDTVKPGFL